MFNPGDKVTFADERSVISMFYEITQAKLIAANGTGPFTIKSIASSGGHIYLEEKIMYEEREEKAPLMKCRFILAVREEELLPTMSNGWLL